MNDAFLVRIFQRRENILRESINVSFRQPGARFREMFRHVLLQITAVDEFHLEEKPALRFSSRINLDYIGMVQPGEGLRFTLEPG